MGVNNLDTAENFKNIKENDLKENYRITIKDKHYIAGEKAESTTQVFGDLILSDDGYTISYTEHAGEFAGCVTNIKVTNEPSSLYLSRTGSFATDLLLEPKRRHSCHYDTPYGSILMGVYAYKIDSNMKSSGGDLDFAYCLDIDGGAVSENELQINVKKC